MATKNLKETDFLKYKAQCIRSSFRQRTKDPEAYVPTPRELETWLRSFEDNFVCYYFRTKLKPSEITIDHKIPLSRLNGNNNLDNLCIASKAANDSKGNLTDTEFFELLKLMDSWEPIAKKNVLTRLKQAGNIYRPSR